MIEIAIYTEFVSYIPFKLKIQHFRLDIKSPYHLYVIAFTIINHFPK